MYFATLLTMSLTLINLAVCAPTPDAVPQDVCEATAQLLDDNKMVERTVVCTAKYDDCGDEITTARFVAGCKQSLGTNNVNTAGCPTDQAETKFTSYLTGVGFNCV